MTITLNPALDLSSTVPELKAGPKLRAATPTIEPGGGGINVSRAIHRLGGQSRALIALAGHTGARLNDLLVDEGITPILVEGPGETRQSLAMTDESDGAQYRFVFPGPPWRTKDVDTFLQAAADAAQDRDFVVLSGSQPPGVESDFPMQLAAALKQKKARLIVDTSGAPLNAVATAEGGTAPWLLRTDHEEAETLAGRALPEIADTADFARSLVDSGRAEVVILARGRDGSVLATADGCHHCTAADVPVVSKVGAGDSFVGAMTLALSRGASLPEALHHGAAAASAAVMTPATQLCRAEDATRLLTQSHLTELR